MVIGLIMKQNPKELRVKGGIKMKTITIALDDNTVTVTDGRQKSTTNFNANTEEDKKAFIALADFFGYEPAYLFNFDDENFEEEFNMNKTAQVWIEELGDPTVEEIQAEIEEVKGAISNEHLWELGYDGNEPMNPHAENIMALMEYLKVLEEMLNNKEE